MTSRASLKVVLFSGGRGSGALVAPLVRNTLVDLTLAINGYDDGGSTGAIRRFLGDSLGPSDFRKNASRVARELETAPPALTDLLDSRLPNPCAAAEARARLEAVAANASIEPAAREAVASRLRTFLRELDRTARAFDFSDCSVGNLVFAGAFLERGRRFNDAVADYCRMLGVPAGVIQNVSDGANAHLVAVDRDGRVLRTEEAIVDGRAANRIRDIFLIDRPLTGEEAGDLERAGADRAVAALAARQVAIRANPVLIERIAEASLIIYAPGTQHSSLFPSYLTSGLTDAIARNLKGLKILVTNIQPDAEIAGSTATDLVERALFYLRGKGRRAVPTPLLITHYLMNDPGARSEMPHVPLGQVEALEDPRLVRIGDFEDGVTGRHDAEKVLAPFVESLLRPRLPLRIAIVLHDCGSLDKVVQSVLELVRGGVADLPLTSAVFHDGDDDPGSEPIAALPFPMEAIGRQPPPALWDRLARDGFDYAVLFESSGMYRGEDVAGLAAMLATRRLDAVWGSRRLSVRDIEQSYRMRYRHQAWLGAASYAGSHVLSLAYLVLYGRYIADTLSGARATRIAYLQASRFDWTHKNANHRLLSTLLADRAEMLETPVRFLPLSPERVKRTSVVDGLRALATIVAERFARRRPIAATPAPQQVASTAAAEKPS